VAVRWVVFTPSMSVRTVHRSAWMVLTPLSHVAISVDTILEMIRFFNTLILNVDEADF
jgi:hypothetical protein